VVDEIEVGEIEVDAVQVEEPVEEQPVEEKQAVEAQVEEAESEAAEVKEVEIEEAASEATATVEAPDEATTEAEMPVADAPDEVEISSADAPEIEEIVEIPASVASDELLPDSGSDSSAETGVGSPVPVEDPTEVDLVAEATVLASYGLYGKAIDRLQELLASSPDRLDARERLVGVYIDQGSLEPAAKEATELARQCFETDAREVWARVRGVLVQSGFAIDRGQVLAPSAEEPAEEPSVAEVHSVEEPSIAEAPSVDAGVGEPVEAADAIPAAIEAELGDAGSELPAADAVIEPAPSEVEAPDSQSDVDLAVAGLAPTKPSEPELTPAAQGFVDPASGAPATEAEWLAASGGPMDLGESLPAADDLFAAEDEFFDLAAELEEELDREGVLPAGELISDIEEQSLDDIVEGFRKGVAEALSPEDFDTHYNLGIAYREMGLVDEAIGEFQLASKDPRYLVDSCSMLAGCFVDKGFPELAIKWFERGLESPAITEEEVWGLRYELGSLYQQMGEVEKAHEEFVEIYGANSNFRDVVAKLEELRNPPGEG